MQIRNVDDFEVGKVYCVKHLNRVKENMLCVKKEHDDKYGISAVFSILSNGKDFFLDSYMLDYYFVTEVETAERGT